MGCTNSDSANSPDETKYGGGRMVGVSQSVKASTFVTQGQGGLQENYKIGKVLGQGGFGEVRLCMHKATKEQRAVKYLQKDKLSPEDKALIMNEVEILSQMDHPNVVRLYEFYDEPHMYCLVQEVVTGGELFDAIIAEGRFAENKAQMLIKRLVGVMNYSHQKGIVHRDLKPENILLEPDMNLDNMKIIDFGTAVPFKINTKKALKEVLGTPFYIAPEVLKGHYTEKCDLWSIGVITFMLLSGKAPFFGKDDHAIFDSVKKGRFEFPAAQWKSVSRQGKDFITKLLTVDYKKRPSAQQALAHPWLSDIKDTVDNHEAADVLTHLKDFRANEILKQAALGYMASQLVGKQEKEKLATMFKSFDKNGDGRLDKKEIQDGYKKFHHKLISDEEVDQIFSQIDVDGSGYIDYTEFVASAMKKDDLMSGTKLERAFHMFDNDNSGSISLKEIRQVLGLTENAQMNEKIKEIIAQCDDNGDGVISLTEFQDMMKGISH